MSKKNKNGWNVPHDLEQLETLMRERWAEINAERRRLVERQGRIEEAIVARKTLGGKPLTERGLRFLLRQLQDVERSLTILYMEGSSVTKRLAVHQNNQWNTMIRDAEEREKRRAKQKERRKQRRLTARQVA